MDGAVGAGNIAQKFVEKYRSLYQSVPKAPDELQDLERELNARILRASDADLFSVNDVQRGLKKLKQRKSDGNQHLYSDHLINGGETLNSARKCRYCVIA